LVETSAYRVENQKSTTIPWGIAFLATVSKSSPKRARDTCAGGLRHSVVFSFAWDTAKSWRPASATVAKRIIDALT
jgi:hypothetical protein